ncbi:unnamed protein product, partial [Prorocentrum cordatum]
MSSRDGWLEALACHRLVLYVSCSFGLEVVELAESAVRRELPASVAWAMARSSRGGGSGSRRSRTYWMCSCGGWNWDWRTTCLGCGYAAPPWAREAAAAKTKPQADKDGWVDQPRGRRAQRQARSAATSAATSKSQTSAPGASGAPSGSGATAIERLQVAVEQLEALQAEPPDGADCCFTDVVASQLEAKRAELAEAQRAAAEQKASSMPLSAMLHKEANAISKAEKRLRAARQSLEQKQEARGLVEAQLQKAEEELEQLDAEGPARSPGLLMQLDKLPEAWGSSNFEVARAAIRSQVEAVRAQLAEAPAVPRRVPWAESCPMDEISSEDDDHAGGCRPWQPQCAAERGQAERRGDARGEWPKVAQACKREPAAEAEDLAPLAARTAGRAAGGRGGGLAASTAQNVRSGLGKLGCNGNARRRGLEAIKALDSRNRGPLHLVMLQEPYLAQRRLEEARGAARRMGYTEFLHASAPTDKKGPRATSGGAAASRHCSIGVTVSAASGLPLRACSLCLQGALGPDIHAIFGDTEYMRAESELQARLAECAGHAVLIMAGLMQTGMLLHRLMKRGLEAAATRRASVGTPWKHCTSPFGAVVPTRARIGWRFKSERRKVTDPGVELDLMHLGAWRASVRHEMRKLSRGTCLQRPLQWDAIGCLLRPDGRPRVREQNALGAYISNAHWRQARLLDVLEAQRRGRVSARLKQCAERARALGDHAGDDFGRCWLPAPEPPQSHHTDAMWVRWACRPAVDKFDGKLSQSGAVRCEGWAIAQCDDDGNLGTGLYGTVWCYRCPQQTAKDGEDLAAWMLATLEGPAVEEVNIDCSSAESCLRRGRADAAAPSRANAHLWRGILAAFEPGAFEVNKVQGPWLRQAVLGGLLTEAQRHGVEHADRLAEMGVQTHAVNRWAFGVHHALAEIMQELGRGAWWAAIVGQGIEARDREELPPAAERRHVRCADAEEESQAAEDTTGEEPKAERPRLESARSTGSSSAALSASAVAFSALGHALSYACAGEGEDTQELVACSKCGAYTTLGGRSGVRPRLKERCPGDKTDEGGRNQRSLWRRGLHPGGKRQEVSRAARHRVNGGGIPALRSQGPVPEHAQERRSSPPRPALQAAPRRTADYLDRPARQTSTAEFYLEVERGWRPEDLGRPGVVEVQWKPMPRALTLTFRLAIAQAAGPSAALRDRGGGRGLDFDDEARKLWARLNLDPSQVSGGQYNALDPLWRHPQSGGTFFVGNQTAASQLKSFHSLPSNFHITHVVNCTDSMPLYHDRPDGPIKYFRFDICSHGRRAHSDAEAVAFVEPMLSFVGAALARGQNVMAPSLPCPSAGGPAPPLLLPSIPHPHRRGALPGGRAPGRHDRGDLPDALRGPQCPGGGAHRQEVQAHHPPGPRRRRLPPAADEARAGLAGVRTGGPAWQGPRARRLCGGRRPCPGAAEAVRAPRGRPRQTPPSRAGLRARRRGPRRAVPRRGRCSL